MREWEQQGDKERIEGSQQAHHTASSASHWSSNERSFCIRDPGPQKGELEESSQRIQVTRLHHSRLYGTLDKQNKTSQSSTWLPRPKEERRESLESNQGTSVLLSLVEVKTFVDSVAWRSVPVSTPNEYTEVYTGQYLNSSKWSGNLKSLAENIREGVGLEISCLSKNKNVIPVEGTAPLKASLPGNGAMGNF